MVSVLLVKRPALVPLPMHLGSWPELHDAHVLVVLKVARMRPR